MDSLHSDLLNGEVRLGLQPVSRLMLPKFKLEDYLDMAAINPTPVFGQVAGLASNWGMCGNDQVGDCVVAGAAHAIMLWNYQASKPVPSFSPQTCTRQYLALTGGLDTGLNMENFTSWWRTTGLQDDSGTTHKILAYADINSLDHMVKAMFAFGVCGLGINVPSTAIGQFDKQQPWDVAGNVLTVGGHFIPLVARNSAGNLVCVTWSRLQAMTPAFIERYAMCLIAYISEEYLTNGVSPRHLDSATLNAALANLAA
jgi:hypothetical protein